MDGDKDWTAELTRKESRKSVAISQHPIQFVREHIQEPIEKDHCDLALLGMCLVTGMVDSATFSNWVVFVGMQTGNTVILGLSTAGIPNNPHAYVTTLVSLSCFLIGNFATFRISRYISPSGPSYNRLWNSLLFTVQGLFILVAAALASVPGLIPQKTAATPDVVTDIRIVALIPLLALQSGMQIACSRLLGFNELPVNVLTSTYCDLMGDEKLFARDNIKRNRRLAACVLVLLGAISSGWLMRTPGGLRSVLWFASGVKLVIGLCVFFLLPPAKAYVPQHRTTT